MAAKSKAASAAGTIGGAASAARSNPYVQRFLEDPELRENVRVALNAARNAYGRMSNGKGPTRALTEDKRVQRDLKQAAKSLREAAGRLQAKPKKKRHLGRKLLLLAIGAGLVLVFSEGARKAVLDALFGAEEEFEYTSSTTPEPAGTPTGTPAA